MSGYDRLTPEGERFYRQINELKSKKVFVGFQSGGAEEDNGTDVVDVAAYNELGTSRIPSRPFIRDSVDKHRDKISSVCKSQVRRLVTGATTEDCLKKIGVFGVSLIQEEITKGSFVPNAESTIRKKGSSKPLIDTGIMQQSVIYVIKDRGEE